MNVDISKHAHEVAATLSRMAGHTPADWTVLQRSQDVTTKWAEQFGQRYVALLYGSSESASIVAERPRGERAQTFAAWYERIATGRPGESFWAEVYLIGFMHASAGVDNGQVVAVTSALEELFLKNAVRDLGPTRGIEVFSAFKRVMDVAIGIMIDSYEHAMTTGMVQLGMNEKLVQRMRRVAIRKMIDAGREALPLIAWNDSLSVGIAEIDLQHKQLIELLNRLHSSKATGKGNDVLGAILHELADYTKKHFAYEEALLAQESYPGLVEHKASHDRLTERVMKFAVEFDAGSNALSAELFMFLRSWLNGHIRGSDRHYAAFLNAKGIR